MIYNNYYAVYVSKNGLIFKVKDGKLSLCNMVPDKDGYFRVSLSRRSQYAKEHKGRHCVHVHRIVAHTFLGEQGNFVVDHKDRNRQNNDISKEQDSQAFSENIFSSYYVPGTNLRALAAAGALVIVDLR